MLLSAPPAAFAQDVVKANNADALNLPTSWTGGVVPTSANVAVWNSTVTAANAPALGGSLAWQGIRVANPSGAITIANTAGATLTLGSSGIDMSAATQNLTINPNLAIGANQTWTVAGGRTLTGIAGSTTSVGTGTGNIIMSQAGAGTATIVFNQNGNGTGWGGYSGNITVNANVKLQSQGNGATPLGTGTLTLAGGQVAQNNGNWTFGNTIDVTAASVIGNDSSSGVGRTMKLLGDLTSTNGSGLTFTNNVTGGTRTDDVGFLLAGANASTYGATTISANSRVRVGGNATATIASPGSDAGTRGSLGTGPVLLAAATAELAFTRSDAHTVGNNISGSGTVVIGGNTAALAGTSTQVVTLSGANTYTGATRVSRSRLNLTGTMTSAITVDNSGSISGTGSTSGLLTLSSGSGLVLAGGATTTSLTVNGATFSGSNVVTFLSNPVTGTVYDVFTYGTGPVTTPANLTVPAYRGTLTNDTVNQKYIFTAGEFGATRTWNTTAGTWQVGGGTANWSGGDGLYYNPDTAVFNEPSAPSTITLSGTIQPGAVQVTNTTNAYTFTGAALAGATALAKSGAGSLSLAAANTYTGGTTFSAGTLMLGDANALGSGGLTFTNTSAARIGATDATGRTVANAITFNNSGTVRFGGGDTGTGDLTFSGAVSLGGDSRTLDVTPSRTTTFAGLVSDGGIIKSGTGALALTNPNTYSGGTTLTEGTLRVGNNAALGTGTVTLNGGTLSSNSGTTRTLANNLVIGSDVSFGDGTNGGQLVFDGAVNLQGATRTLTSVLGTQGARFNGVISNGGITMAGTGRITLANDSGSTPNTFTGPTTITAGILATSLNALASSGSVTITGGSLALGSNGTTTINNLSGLAAGRIDSAFNISSDGARTLQINQSVDGTYAGSIGQGSGRTITLIKTGTARLTLGGASTHTGGTTLAQGTLVADNSTALGTGGTVTINDATTGATNTALLLGNVTMSRPITVENQGTGIVTLGANGSVALPTFSGAVTLSRDVILDGSTNTDRLTFSGGIGGTGNVTISGANRVVFTTTANTYAGSTTIAANAILQLGTGSAAATQFIPNTSVVTMGGGSFLKLAKGSNNETIGGLAGSGTVRGHEASASAASVLIIDTSGNHSFGGILEDGGAAGSTLALTKSGAGIQTLTGTNTYTGATAITGGTLLVNGGLTGTSVVSVSAGATLGGSGTIARAVSILGGGIVSPGTSPGTLTVNNTFTLADTSILDFELNPTSNTVGGGINDLITGVTNLTLDGVLHVSGAGDWAAVPNQTAWRLFNYSGLLTDNTLSLGTMPFPGSGRSFVIDTATAGQVNLVIVPEPGTLAVGIAAAALAGWLVRRRR